MTNESYSLLWIIDNNLAELLDRATWLETSAELCNLGWQVTLVSPGFPNGDLDVRITTVRVPSPELYLVGRLIFQFLITLRIVFLSRDADIVLFHQYSGPFVLPQVLLRKILRRSRPVFIMDSRTAPMDTTSIRGRLWMLYLEISRKMANRLADGQTSITQRLARLQGMPDAKLMGVWPSGVKLDRFKQASSLRCWPSEKDPLRLIYIGVLARERNLSALIEAVLKVRSDGDKVELYLVGDGVQRTEIEEIVRKNNDGAIKLFPPVPPVEIPRILASAHVGVLPFPDFIY